MRPQHRLRAAQMRVAGNHRVRIALARRSSSACISAGQQRARAIDLLAQPQPHIERHLLVAAAAGVDLVGQRARRVSFSLRMTSVWTSSSVAPAIERRRRALRRESRRRPSTICARSVRRQDARRVPAPARTPASRGYRRRSAAGRNASDPEKRSKTSDGPVLEPAAPELHASCALRLFSAARTLIGRPIRLMKPSASFWS